MPEPFNLPRAPEELRTVAELTELVESLDEEARAALARQARDLLRLARASTARRDAPLDPAAIVAALQAAPERLKALAEGLVAQAATLALEPVELVDKALAATLADVVEPELLLPSPDTDVEALRDEAARALNARLEPLLKSLEALTAAEQVGEAVERARREVEGLGRDILPAPYVNWASAEGFLLGLLEALAFGPLENVVLAVEG